MNVGDLYFSFRGDGARLQKDAKVEGDKAGDSFAATFKKSFSGANLGKGLAQGLGLAGALGGVNLISTAVSKFTDIIQDSVQAALADEESQNRLAASLRTNVANWDGNTKAIEANILTKQRLGFQDEQLRDSLTVLVGATHDVAKAQEIQNTAMDLARFKGIDLQTASEALIKVQGGAYRSLKQLGIQLRDGATQTEALAAVQKVAAGQAEAYAQTNRGKLEASQIALGEAMENFGGTIMPAVVAITQEASSVATDLAGNLKTAGDVAQQVGKIMEDLGVGSKDAADGGFDFVHSLQDLLAVGNPTKVSNTLGVLLDTIDKMGVSTEAAREQLAGFGLDIRTNLPEAATTTDKAAGKMADDLGIVQDALGDTSQAAVDWRDKFRDVAGAVIRSANKIRHQFVADAKAMIDGYYDPLETRANLHDTRLQLLADKETLRLAKTKEERRQARDDIVNDLHDEATALTDLADSGKLTADDVRKFAKDARSQYGSMSKSAIADTEAIIRKLQELAGLKPKVKITLDVQMSAADKALLQKVTKHAAGHGPTEFGASGGRFAAGTNLITGENGWEAMRLLPGGGAEVLSHPQSVAALAGATAGAGGGGGIHVHLEDRLQVRSVRDIADGLRMVERQGYLRRAR
jgi:hypothetical protein